MAIPSIATLTLNALLNDQARVDRVAANLANLATPAYKRELWVERHAAPSSFDRLIEGAGGPAYEATGSTPVLSPLADMPLSQSALDLRPGTLKTTGRPLDVALTGPGFFELISDQGPLYTRHGGFLLDAGGRIVDHQGLPVMGTGGEITATSDKISVDTQGTVSQDGRVIGQLRVMDWTADQLTAVGGGNFRASGAPRPVEGATLSMRQGFLENPNVNTAHEMVALSAALRHFEANLRVAQGRDELLGTAIRMLGEL